MAFDRPGVTIREVDVTSMVPRIPKRFIPSLRINGKWTLIISDYHFWMGHEVDLENSVIDCNGVREGMTISFDTKEERTWFLLRWQG